MKAAESTDAPLLTRPEAAAYLRLSQRKLDQLAANGRLPRVVIDRAVRFDRNDLDRFIQASKSG
jgi:excisionase family DNA binding protein